MYTSGGENTGLEVLLGASSIDDLISRIDTVEPRLGPEHRGPEAGEDLPRRRSRSGERVSRTAHVEQARLVAERSAQKASIEGQLAERRQLLSSIKSEIGQIQAAERAQQAAAGRPGAGAALDRRRRSAERERRRDRRTRSTRLRTAAREVRRRRRDRDAVPRDPVRLRRVEPVRLRLLGLRHVRLRAGRRLAAAQRGRAVRLRDARLAAISSSPATWSSSTVSGTSGSTSAAASSSTRRTRATW